jgi:hypothetical protein
VSGVFIKRGYYRERVASFIKKSPRPQRSSDCGLPPEHTLAAAIRRFQDHAIYFLKKLLLSFVRFWKWPWPFHIFAGIQL